MAAVFAMEGGIRAVSAPPPTDQPLLRATESDS